MKAVLFVGVICFLISCKGIVGNKGKVYDSETKIPLDNVKIEHYLDGKEQESSYTDDQGAFDASTFVGCVPDCPQVSIVLKKDGYQTRRYFFYDNLRDSSGVKIYLKRIK